MKVSNIKCRSKVQNLESFQGSNLYGQRGGGDFYVVYSYGEHWPLFVHKNGTWYENSEKYSVTTSKHRSQSHPGVETVLKTMSELKKMI